MAVETRTDGGIVADTAPSRLSWPAIFGGSFVSLGLWVFLGAFGLAAGLSAVSPADPSLGGVAIWLGIWSLIVPIIALFFGSWIASRAAGAIRTSTGLLYGAVVWGLTTFATTVFAAWGTGAVASRTLGAAATLASGATSVVASAVGSVAQGGGGAVQSAASFLGVNRADLMAVINQRLAAQGKPQIRAEALQAALRDAVNTAIRQGTMNEELLVTSLAQNTKLSREDVRELAQSLQQQWNQVTGTISGGVQEAAQAARNAAFSALDMVGAAFWWIFGSVGLGLVAALGAGWLGTRRRYGEQPAAAPTGARRFRPTTEAGAPA